MALDFEEPVNKVRVLIPDLVALPDPADPDGPKSTIFTDDEIQAFISLGGETTYGLKRAAAYAMVAIANTENLILKKIVSQDQQTDGPAVAKQLIASAATLFEQAAAEEKLALAAIEMAIASENLFAVFPVSTTVPVRPEGTNEDRYVYGLGGIY